MDLKSRITEDMKQAMRSKDAERLSAIRLLLAAIKQREIDERTALDDTQVLSIIDKMVKQRRDSIAQFEAARRNDLVAKEQFELGVLQAYMPQGLSDTEIDAAIAEAIANTSAAGPKDMGRVMQILKPALAGRADLTAVSTRVKERLSAS